MPREAQVAEYVYVHAYGGVEYLSGVASWTLLRMASIYSSMGFILYFCERICFNLRGAKIRDSCPCLVELGRCADWCRCIGSIFSLAGRGKVITRDPTYVVHGWGPPGCSKIGSIFAIDSFVLGGGWASSISLLVWRDNLQRGPLPLENQIIQGSQLWSLTIGVRVWKRFETQVHWIEGFTRKRFDSEARFLVEWCCYLTKGVILWCPQVRGLRGPTGCKGGWISLSC